jgi:hypothetical protein
MGDTGGNDGERGAIEPLGRPLGDLDGEHALVEREQQRRIAFDSPPAIELRATLEAQEQGLIGV